MLNKLILVANLTKDPELRYTPQGTAVCKLRLASSRLIKIQNGAEPREEKLFISATLWAKRAENCAKYLKKGSHVFVEGPLATRSWETDGQRHSVIEMSVDTIQFLDRVKEGTSPQTNGEELPPER